MFRARITLLATLVFGLSLHAEPRQPQATKPDRAKIAAWVTQLGDNDFDKREEASRKLWEAGEFAEAALQEAVKSTDPEVKRRAQELLDKFKWGIYPTTPKAIVDLIGRYQGGQDIEKNEAIRDLLDHGPMGWKVLLKLIAAEEPGPARMTAQARIAEMLPGSVPLFLARKEFTTLETFLTAGTEGANPAAMRNLVAYWLMRGQIDQKIDHYKALQAKGDKTKKTTDILVALYRAKGDHLEAHAVARRAGRDDLVNAMRYEIGDWTGGAWADEDAGPRTIEQLGYRVACKRLRGTPKEFEEALAEVRKRAKALKPEDAAERMQLAGVFFRNQCSKEGLALLQGNNENTLLICGILVYQNRHPEALALVEKSRQAIAKIKAADEKMKAEAVLVPLEKFEARILGILGEKDKARQTIARLEKARHASDVELLQIEVQGGLLDDAFDRVSQEKAPLPFVAAVLFPQRPQTALSLLAALKALFPLDNDQASLKKVRAAMSGQVPRQDLARWLDNAEAAIKKLSPVEAGQWRLALAEAALMARQNDLAQQCLEKGTGAEVWLRLGDILAGKKEWEQAARRYYQAWEKDRRQALPLYLSGKALVRAGQDKEGRQRIDYAHWLPLANDAIRHAFIAELNARRDTQALLHEADLQFRLGQPGSLLYNNLAVQVAFTASQRHELAKASDHFERFLLFRSHNSGVYDFGVLPGQAGTYQAARLLDAGKVNEALAVIGRCQEVRGGFENLATVVVPQLDRMGKKKEADAVFEKTFAVVEDLCRRYPKSALLHNDLAWTCAVSRRKLDLGLEHAREAVRLKPESANHMDTLAEIYFQRGERNNAIETAKKALALEAYQAYYHRALKRIRAGQPKDLVLSQLIYGSAQLSVLLTDDEE